jgi:hypothetical protein
MRRHGTAGPTPRAADQVRGPYPANPAHRAECHRAVAVDRQPLGRVGAHEAIAGEAGGADRDAGALEIRRAAALELGEPADEYGPACGRVVRAFDRDAAQRARRADGCPQPDVTGGSGCESQALAGARDRAGDAD